MTGGADGRGRVAGGGAGGDGTRRRAGAATPAPNAPTRSTVEELVAAVDPVDDGARAAAMRRNDALAKPPGSLGAVEALGAQLAAIAGRCPPPVPAAPRLLVAAADHGVHAEGVTAWPAAVTAAVVAAACTGRSVAAVMAGAAGIPVTVLDVGLAHDPGEHPTLVRRPVRAGTRNLRAGPAMTVGEVRAAVATGAAVAATLLSEGADVLLVGEVGIANTTATACLIAALTGAPAADVTGRGAGADDAMLARKTAVVAAAAGRCTGLGPLEVLAGVGGLEHAALVGAMLAAAGRRVPILLDGVVTGAAALVGAALRPALRGYLVASHRAAEAGAPQTLAALGLHPLLDLDLRLGEGTGALLAAPLLRAVAAVLARTALLDELT